MSDTLRAMIILEGESETIKFDRAVFEMHRMGMTPEQITDAILDDFLNEQTMFGGIRSEITDELAGAVNQVESIAINDTYENELGDAMMQWVSIGDDKVCRDCEDREGQVRSLAEWNDVGTPSSGFSICGERCRCRLVPSDVEVPTQILLRQ
jgi:hypothetical protein